MSKNIKGIIMLLKEKVYLPFSSRRYSIDKLGKLTDAKNNVVSTFIKGNEIFVKLDWVEGRKEYKLAILVLVAYGKVNLPDHLISRVEPLYLDGDSNNLSPINILYKYINFPLEVEEFSGFYYVPFYDNYAIDKNGVILNITTGKIKTWSTMVPISGSNKTSGYRYTRVVNNFGNSKLLFMHRAMCLVFLDYDQTVEKLVVNHKNGITSDNSINNLEWCTYRENNIHAIKNGLRLKVQPILMKNLITNEVKRFSSAGECGKYLGKTRGEYIRNRLISIGGKVYNDMLIFKVDDGSEWPDVKDMKICRLGKGSDIVARNIFTGDIIIFNGINEGFNLTKVKPETILRHVNDEVDIPINGFNFRYYTDNLDWPKHSARHLIIYDKFPVYPSDGVIMTDAITGEDTFFPSAAEACNVLKISRQLLGYYINNKLTYKDKFILTYFKIRCYNDGPVIE